jgi:transposase
MFGSMADRIILSPPERRQLQRMSRSRSVRAEDARRARIILSLASGSLSLWAISRQERCSINTVRMWRDRFKEGRLPGLWSRHRGRAPSEGVEKLEARIIDWTLHRKPTDGSTHWSSRKLGSALGIDHMRVARVWAKAGLQPHRRRHYMVSDDPEFEKEGSPNHRSLSEASRPCGCFLCR